MHQVGTWLLITLLAFQAVAHLVLTVLFYAGVHEQGYGFFLNFTWPAWLITVLDLGAAASLWWAYRAGRDRATTGLALTVAACAYLSGRMAWTIVVPLVSFSVLIGAILRHRSVGVVADAECS